MEESFNESDRMKLSHKETKTGKFVSNVWTLELPEPIPEFGNTKYSSGTKSQMKQLAKKYGRKYGWTLEESSVVGGVYVNNTANIAGSAQTRIWGRRFNWMVDLDRKEPIEIEMDNPTDKNIIGRRGLTFDDVLGAYVPKKNTDYDTEFLDSEDED